MERLALRVEAGRERRLEGVQDGLLCQPDSHRALGPDRPRDALGLLQPVLLGGNSGDEPRLLGLAGGQEAAREDDVHRLRLPDRARQSLRAARPRQDAEVGLRLSELRRLGGDDQVASHRQLAAAAQAVARHRGDDRRPDLPDRVPLVDPPAEVELEVSSVGKLVDVGAGGEGLVVSREDDAADRLVVVEVLERPHELAHELVRERVQLFGPVEADNRDRLVPLNEDGHFFSRNFLIAS